MTDTITFTFADATTFSLTLASGEGLDAVNAIIERKGSYRSGWVRDADEPNRFYNLHAATRMDISSD